MSALLEVEELEVSFGGRTSAVRGTSPSSPATCFVVRGPSAACGKSSI